MDIWLILVIGLAPGLFWLWYFYHQDVCEPEPHSLVAKMFFLGMAAVPIALVSEDICGVFISGIIYIAVAAPIIEESIKFLMVRYFVYNNREFDEPMDGIVYATATALGFATLENVFYILNQPSLPSFFITGTVRAVISVPGHALFAVFWGYGLGIAKFRSPGRRNSVIIWGLVLGIAVHGLFNLLLEQSYVGLAILILAIIPLVWWIAEKDIRAALLGAHELPAVNPPTGK